VDVTHLIAIQGVKPRPANGKLMLTTVSLVPSIRIAWLVGKFVDPSVAVVSRSAIIQPGQSEQDVEQETVTQMQESQVAAATAALRLLGRKVQIKYTGIRVIGIAADTPAAAVLHTGDMIAAVDGRPVSKPIDLVHAIHRHSVGQSVVLKVVRGTKTLTLTVGTVARPTNKNDPVIGVIIDSVPQVDLPVAISIDAEGIGGPSAGLMFALGIVDLLGHKDLAHGRFIAGTGEIDFDGTVGAVGGVQQKIEGARRAHAVLFLTPLDEFHDACAAAHGMHVVAVATLKDAVSVLQGGRVPAGRECS
jgi:PDZ domain-containing protein